MLSQIGKRLLNLNTLIRFVLIVSRISESNTTNCGICNMPGSGSVLHDCVHILHSSVDSQGKEVCPVVHVGEHLLHHEVCFVNQKVFDWDTIFRCMAAFHSAVLF